MSSRLPPLVDDTQKKSAGADAPALKLPLPAAVDTC